MKKLLALVLALVMTLGLATVAANASFPDAADIDLTEAADVMAAVGVFKGDEKGNFAPKANLSRDAAAKLIAYLALGEKVAEALPAVQVFNDVPATHWAAKYVAYCADAGYIAGDGNGNFLPTGALTGYAFGKMVLCALGYDAQIEGFVGSAWTLKVAKLMEENKINKGVSGDASAVLTREQAAQYCLNALKATMVEYNDKSVISIGDVKIEQSSKASKVLSGNDSIKDDGYLQLGEKLYKNDLKLKEDETDDFGRPASKWTYEKETVATVTEKAAATFTAETKADAVATALKGYKVVDPADAEKTVKINNVDKKYEEAAEDNFLEGQVVAGTKTIAALVAARTANGKLVEVYANDDDVMNKIVEIEYTNEKVTKVSTDKKTGDVTYTLSESGDKIDSADEDKDDKISFTTAPAKDDYVTTATVGGVTYVYPTTKVEGAVTSAKGNEKLTIGGTSYTANEDYAENGGDFALTAKDKVATIYVDQYGFVSAYKGPSSSGDKSIIISDKYTSLESGKLVTMVKGVLSNGETMTSKTTTDIDDIEVGQAYGYKDDATVKNAIVLGAFEKTAVDESDSVIKLADNTALAASDKKVKLNATVYGYFNSDVKVIFVKDNGNTTVAEGTQKIAAAGDKWAVLKVEDGVAYIKALYVNGAPSNASTSTDDVIFVSAKSTETVRVADGDDDTADFNYYTAYLKGEKIANFYAADGSDRGFYSKDVETSTGAYILEGNEYTEDDGTAAVSGELTVEKNEQVNKQNILTIGNDDYVLTNTDFVETRTGDDIDAIDSISDLNDALKKGDVSLYFMYNTKTMEVAYAYIVTPSAA